MLSVRISHVSTLRTASCLFDLALFAGNLVQWLGGDLDSEILKPNTHDLLLALYPREPVTIPMTFISTPTVLLILSIFMPNKIVKKTQQALVGKSSLIINLSMRTTRKNIASRTQKNSQMCWSFAEFWQSQLNALLRHIEKTKIFKMGTYRGELVSSSAKWGRKGGGYNSQINHLEIMHIK